MKMSEPGETLPYMNLMPNSILECLGLNIFSVLMYMKVKCDFCKALQNAKRELQKELLISIE